MFLQTATVGHVIGIVVSAIGVGLLMLSIAFLNNVRSLALSLGAGLGLAAIGIVLVNDEPDKMSLVVGMGLIGLFFFGIGVKLTLEHRRAPDKTRR